jgi:hypothetical protein
LSDRPDHIDSISIASPLQLFDQFGRSFVENRHELLKNREVEGWG